MTDTPISREQAIEALETRVEESEQRAARNEFGDAEWERGWLIRRRGMEDALNIISALPPLNSLREPLEPSIYSHDENHLPDNELPGMWERSDYEGGETDSRDAILTTSPPIQGEGACPHVDLHGDSWKGQTIWGKPFAHCPDCGQPLSSPQEEGR